MFFAGLDLSRKRLDVHVVDVAGVTVLETVAPPDADGLRRLVERLAVPDPWRSDVLAAVALIDEIDRQIDGCERELRRLGADHRYVPLLMTVPGIAWVLGYTIAAEIGDITRFVSAKKLAG